MNIQEWLEAKYRDWEKSQPGRPSYYLFARYLDVNHSDLSLWISGAAIPKADDLAKLAGKLGSEIYALAGGAPGEAQTNRAASEMALLPAALRARLTSAIGEVSQLIQSRGLSSESDEAKRLAVKIFDKWGFHISG